MTKKTPEAKPSQHGGDKSLGPTLAIEKGVPIPSTALKIRYPLADMNVGDSFLVPDDTSGAGPAHLRVRAAVSHFSKRNNKRFIVRKVEGGHRCWRIE